MLESRTDVHVGFVPRPHLARNINAKMSGKIYIFVVSHSPIKDQARAGEGF